MFNSFNSKRGSFEKTLAWDGNRFDLDDSNELELDATPSPVILRPDFEDEHKEDFIEALGFWHKYQYAKALDVISRYLQKEDQGIAAKASFRLLRQLMFPDTSPLWGGPRPDRPFETLHIEDLMYNLACCTNVWMARSSITIYSQENEKQKLFLRTHLTSALSQIREWIPIPPVNRVEITDMKVY